MKQFKNKLNAESIVNMAIDILRKFCGGWAGRSITSGFTDYGPCVILNCAGNAKAKNDISAMVKTPVIRSRLSVWIIFGAMTLWKKTDQWP